MKIKELFIFEKNSNSYHATDVHHNPDNISVLVYADGTVDLPDEEYKNYFGINVVFGLDGTIELVTSDSRSDDQAKRDRDKIIAVAKKELSGSDIMRLRKQK